LSRDDQACDNGEIGTNDFSYVEFLQAISLKNRSLLSGRYPL